jgi:serine/threonine protein kinase
VLKEVVAFKIAEKIAAGPLLVKPFGFDLLIYLNCIEFAMEFCNHTLDLSRGLEKDLQSALLRMHSLKLIHFDIKPENICFSPYFQKYVFIDFGLHRIIKE